MTDLLDLDLCTREGHSEYVRRFIATTRPGADVRVRYDDGQDLLVAQVDGIDFTCPTDAGTEQHGYAFFNDSRGENRPPIIVFYPASHRG